jgi:hypothetical protein
MESPVRFDRLVRHGTTRIALCLSVLALLPKAQAADALSVLTPDQRDSLSAGYAQCAAYFTITWKGLARSGEVELASTTRGFATVAMSNSYDLAVTSRSSAMARKVVGARFKLYGDGMLADIEYDFSNVSVLINKYGKNCAVSVSDFSEFAREYFKPQAGQ